MDNVDNCMCQMCVDRTISNDDNEPGYPFDPDQYTTIKMYKEVRLQIHNWYVH